MFTLSSSTQADSIANESQSPKASSPGYSTISLPSHRTQPLQSPFSTRTSNNPFHPKPVSLTNFHFFLRSTPFSQSSRFQKSAMCAHTPPTLPLITKVICSPDSTTSPVAVSPNPYCIYSHFLRAPGHPTLTTIQITCGQESRGLRLMQ
jgi:hypothetical protein